MLEIDSLSAAYPLQRSGQMRAVLKNISLTLHEGEILAVIGPNGAGKSTLVRALSGVIPLQSGTVRVAGRDAAALTPVERARWIAVVPQARNLPPAFTAWETVLLGRTPHLNWLGQVGKRDTALARQAMERTHTLHLADRLVGELSGGEQQRLLLARALTQSAPFLLMDEPTTHLDLQHQLSLLEQVRRLTHQPLDGAAPLAVLVVLHDLNLVARFADRVALMVDGELTALGSPAEVLTPALLSQAYHLPLQVHSGAQGVLSISY